MALFKKRHIHKVKRRPNKFKMPEITLTPLVDTALTLVVILMVAAPMVQNGIKLNLPVGQSKEVGNQQEFVISFTKDEKLFFNSYPLVRSELIPTLKRELGKNEESTVHIRADESVSYGRVITLLDELKTAGIRNVAMSTRTIT